MVVVLVQTNYSRTPISVSHCLVVLLVILLLAGVIGESPITSVAGLDYSYAEGTPGTNNRIMSAEPGNVRGNINDVVAQGVATPLPANEIVHDRGQTIAGALAGGANGWIDCGAIITTLSAYYKGINNHPRWTNNDRAGRDVMNRPVIGVAVVDYGNVAGGGLHAYLARSGVANVADPLVDVHAERVAAEGAGVAELNHANQWTLFSTVVENHATVRDHRSTRIVPLPGGQNVAAWVPDAGQPQGIQFLAVQALNPVQGRIVKKWPNDNNAVNGLGPLFMDESNSNNFNGGCAMQKLMGNLYGYNGPLPAFPGGGVRPFLGPNAQNALAAPKLVCAAEAAHAMAINVRNWANEPINYLRKQEVPSCVACQAYIPEVITQRAGECTIRVEDYPVGSSRGTCPEVGSRLHHTGTCQLECQPGYHLAGPPAPATTSCRLGQFIRRECLPNQPPPPPPPLPRIKSMEQLKPPIQRPRSANSVLRFAQRKSIHTHEQRQGVLEPEL